MSEIRHQPLAPTHVMQQSAGAVIDRHRHDEHQLIYVSTGVLAISTAVGSWVAASDRAVWVPGGLWHEHRFFGASTFHTVGFPLRRAPLPADEPRVVAVGSLLRELLVACTEPELPIAQERRLRAVLHDRLRRATEQPLRLPTAVDERLRQACHLVETDLARPRTLAQVGRAIGAGDRTLSRLFRAEFGMSYPQWRTHLRVFHAMTRLSAGTNVTDTGRSCGFATTSAFVDTFARVMGQTPGQYRAATGLSAASARSPAPRPRPSRGTSPT